MTLAKNTTPILKMNSKLPLVGKRCQASFSKSRPFHPLPPSLLKLPTMGSSSDLSLQDSSTSLSLDLELNDTALDNWLVRLDKVAKASEDERKTSELTRSVSRVTFASLPERSKSTGSLPSSSSEPAKKRRRFARRNSFIVRDLAQLSRIAEQADTR